MDRQPLPAPFPVGARVRYLGTMASYADRECTIPLRRAGMEFEIIEVKPGRRGTLCLLPAEFQDELDDEPLRDTTRDGYSIYASHGHRYLIAPEMACDWQAIDSPVAGLT